MPHVIFSIPDGRTTVGRTSTITNINELTDEITDLCTGNVDALNERFSKRSSSSPLPRLDADVWACKADDFLGSVSGQCQSDKDAQKADIIQAFATKVDGAGLSPSSPIRDYTSAAAIDDCSAGRTVAPVR